MKRGLLSLACVLTLAGISRAKESAQWAPTLPAQDASVRVDMALMHDYELANEMEAKYNRPSHPALPPMADDAAFLRRACIDLAGRLPQADEVRRFLADTDPNKRTKLTDALTREPGATEMRYRMLAEVFRVTDADPVVIAWLRQAAQEDRPYAEVIIHMIGGGHMSRRDGGNPMHTTVETARSVLGKDFYCAMCHDHPFSNYTQLQCLSFVACFADKDSLRLPADYKYANHEPGQIVFPQMPNLNGRYGWGFFGDEGRLQQVARWITEKEDTRSHAMVAALRAWNGLFGMPGLVVNQAIGGVEDAPPWHGVLVRSATHYHRSCFGSPTLFQPTWVEQDINSPGDFSQAPKVLVEEFLRCGGRIGEFQRILARTNAYWRSGHAPSTAWNGCYLVPAPQIRRLPAEVIWTTLTGEKDTQLAEVPPKGHPLRMLGRSTREWADERLTPISHELARFMINHAPSHLEPPLNKSADDLFLQLLGRLPEKNELAAIARQAASSEDIAWALLNTKEFMFRP